MLVGVHKLGKLVYLDPARDEIVFVLNKFEDGYNTASTVIRRNFDKDSKARWYVYKFYLYLKENQTYRTEEIELIPEEDALKMIVDNRGEFVG